MRASVELLVNLEEQDTPLFNTLPITSISKHFISNVHKLLQISSN